MQEVQTSLKLPAQLQYENIIPKGYPSIYKQWINDPLTGNKSWANNDIVRWNFMNSGKGVFDPYRSFIEISVITDPVSMPVGLLQVDNSAHSFINQIVLYSNNREIQRITQYDVLLAYLNDIGMNEFLSEGKQTQGLGYGNVQNVPLNNPLNSQSNAPRSINCSSGAVSNQPYVGLCQSTGNVFPTIGNSFPTPPQTNDYATVTSAAKIAKGHITSANVCVFGNDLNYASSGSSNAITASINSSGYANNMRAQYLLSFMTSKYPQHSQSVPNYELKLSQTVSGGKYPFFFSPQTPYLTTTSSTSQQTISYGSTTNQWPQGTNIQAIVNCNNFGYGTPYSPFFTKGTFQPFISATVPQCMISQGVFATTKFPIWRKTFKIPLASSVIGCSIDPSSYCLIPLQSINDLLLQLTLDPYAMFTSGYCDVSQYDTVGCAIQQKRNWTVQRLQYKLHTYYFVDQQVQKYIKASLYKQITVVSNFWALGNQYQIQGGTQVNNTYIVGCSSSNLNEIVCLFVANDYQKWSFCRKHFRLSNNIKRFWSKLAVDYWPPQPFKGNGGNAMSNNINDDNSIFIENLYWANNYVFNKNSLPRLNIYNFAMNQRCYDPTVVSTFYDPATLNNPSYTNWGILSVNGDTAMGMPYFHENRAVGKAAYIIVYTPFTQQQGLLNGIDVSGLSNFQVVFQTDSSNVFPRDQTLYIYCKSSVIVKYTANGIITIGR